MTVLSPVYGWFSALLIATILLYFFRKQYEEQLYSSTFLWKQAMKEVEASTWLHKLQNHLLLWLQLLIMTLLILSLMKPIFFTQEIEGDHVIFIIDTSASMAVTKEGMNRLQLARKQINGKLDELKNQKITIIEASEATNILVKAEKDVRKAKDVIEELELSYKHEDLDQAISLAIAMAKKESSSIYVYSHALNEERVPLLPDNSTFHAVNLHENPENVSITSFGLQERDSIMTAVAVIKNEANSEKTVPFQITANGEVVYEETITIAAQKEKILNIPSLPTADYYVAIIDIPDEYDLDQFLYTVATSSNPPIYAIGEVSPFWIKGFTAIGAEVIQVSSSEELNNQEAKIVLVDREQAADYKNVPLFVIADSVEVQSLGAPITSSNDKLIQYVDMSEIFVAGTGTFYDADFDSLVNSGSTALIQKSSGVTPVISVNFPLHQSDWPLHPSFPIFLYQTYQWLGEQTRFLGAFHSGEQTYLNVSNEGNTLWDIFNIENKLISTWDSSKEFLAPALPGVYRIVQNNYSLFLSVTLDKGERDIAGQPSFMINGTQTNELNSSGNRDVGVWLVLFSILILVFEWEVFRRGN
ncbi:vWA domain-containing protein [Bacillus sp. 2205SS5-2]|uniref:vWA domain-containing protein n=1 Tax=Bacillus sp. 2205SS5-2 TaxID=3109031 RepID=UPI003004EDA5